MMTPYNPYEMYPDPEPEVYSRPARKKDDVVVLFEKVSDPVPVCEVDLSLPLEGILFTGGLYHEPEEPEWKALGL